ncbi:hypothetical protein LIER_02379 [Lithospermum erythrorhizon]|uniref:Reverse transcriptase domain-containing protein n=1 Tax=Lithospermum erythrorhizon TaxID=34254 RepID=A0AAV3NPB4_LITER
MTDFRPISLSNVVAKIIGPVMTNRLRFVLMNIISETQSAFLRGRIISDNILITHEVLHFMDQKCNSKNHSMALKLDMSKAHMLKFGFCRKWVDWTMCLVSTVSYGAPRGFIRTTRGIRQGDPLLPYLFLLCVEGLTCMLRAAKTRHALTGIRISRESPSISHILFADDNMIFCRANEREGSEVKHILGEYEVASGVKN